MAYEYLLRSLKRKGRWGTHDPLVTIGMNDLGTNKTSYQITTYGRESARNTAGLRDDSIDRELYYFCWGAGLLKGSRKIFAPGKVAVVRKKRTWKLTPIKTLNRQPLVVGILGFFIIGFNKLIASRFRWCRSLLLYFLLSTY